MAQPQHDVIHELYEALATGDRATLDRIVAPDFEGVLAEGMPGGVGGSHHGATAMIEQGWGGIGRSFRARAEPTSIDALVDGRVLVTGRYRGTGRRGSAALDAAFVHVVTLREGRISRLEQHTDTARWAAAAPPLTTLTVQVNGGVATVRLDRPDRGNAFDDVMGREFVVVADTLAGDDSVRAVLLLGASHTFCVGGDVGLFGGTATADLPARLGGMVDDLHLAIERLSAADAPVVAGVQGVVGGAGLGLLGLADIVVAAEDAVFAVGYAGIGLTADGGVSWSLPRLVGLRKAQELVLLGRRFSAAEALAWGLVTQVVPADDVESTATAIATRLAAGPTRSTGAVRRLLRQSLSTGLHEQLAAERASIVAAAGTEDFLEGVQAFNDHRRPDFTGR